MNGENFMAHSLPADFHIHTHHSGDCESPMEKIIEKALEKKLSAICITEHMDMDYPITPTEPEGLFEVDTDAYQRELILFKEKYAGIIDIHFGIELGLQPHIVDGFPHTFCDRTSIWSKSHNYSGDVTLVDV